MTRRGGRGCEMARKRSLNLLPPLHILVKWREDGCSPEEMFARAKRFTQKSTKITAQGRVYNPDEIYEIYQSHSLIETGQIVGLTGERVRQILRDANLPRRSSGKSLKPKRTTLPIREILRLRLEEQKTVDEIAYLTYSSPSSVGKLLRDLAVPKPHRPKKILGQCPNCKSRPKARGMCNACYVSWHKRGKPPLEG